MSNVETLKYYAFADSIITMVPGVNVVTMLAQLIFRLCYKIDRACNPVKQSFMNDLKIYILSNDIQKILIGAVPLLGNLNGLAMFVQEIVRLFVNYNDMKRVLATANFAAFKLLIETRKWNLKALEDTLRTLTLREEYFEMLKLCIEKYPLTDEEIAGAVLGQAAYSDKSKEAISFNLVFGSRKNWSIDSLIDALGGCTEKIADTLLNYLESNYSNPKQWGPHEIRAFYSKLKSYINYDKSLLIQNRMIQLRPICSFGDIREIIEQHSCIAKDKYNPPKVLPEEVRKLLLEKCMTCSIKDLGEYFKFINYRIEDLDRDTKQVNKNDRVEYNKRYNKLFGGSGMQLSLDEKVMSEEIKKKQALLSDFCKVHFSNIEILLKILNLDVLDKKSKEDFLEVVQSMVRAGNLELVTILLDKIEKYENLSCKDRFWLINQVSFDWYDEANNQKRLKVFEFLVKRFKASLTEEQWLELLKQHQNEEEMHNKYK